MFITLGDYSHETMFLLLPFTIFLNQTLLIIKYYVIQTKLCVACPWRGRTVLRQGLKKISNTHELVHTHTCLDRRQRSFSARADGRIVPILSIHVVELLKRYAFIAFFTTDIYGSQVLVTARARPWNVWIDLKKEPGHTMRLFYIRLRAAYHRFIVAINSFISIEIEKTAYILYS